MQSTGGATRGSTGLWVQVRAFKTATGPPDSFIGIREFRYSESEFSPLGYKTGIVAAAQNGLIFRTEVAFQHVYALPNVMVRIAVGWRF
jgi:hypothetical protein